MYERSGLSELREEKQNRCLCEDNHVIKEGNGSHCESRYVQSIQNVRFFVNKGPSNVAHQNNAQHGEQNSTGTKRARVRCDS